MNSPAQSQPATKPAHTPTPWAVNYAPNGETSGIISANNGLTHIADTFDASWHNAIARGQTHPATEFLAAAQANAALIVRAVNSHAELVAALRAASVLLWKNHKQLVAPNPSDIDEAFEMMRAALAKAQA